MHINGIMTEMCVRTINTTYGSELVECHLQDMRSRKREATIQ